MCLLFEADLALALGSGRILEDLPAMDHLVAPRLPAAGMSLDDFDLWSAGPPTRNGGSSRRAKAPVTKEVSRRNRNNGKRGRSDELEVAKILGGRKVGQLNLPWDVEVAGYMRVQAKKLADWPSLNQVIAWLDAIPPAPEMAGVTLANAPGPGKRVRRLLIVDLERFASWHGRSHDDES